MCRVESVKVRGRIVFARVAGSLEGGKHLADTHKQRLSCLELTQPPRTLQELIAPQKVWFYDQTWTECGTKISQKSLVSEITGIQQEILEGSTAELSKYSIAQKMCWASRRTTTRQEDMAYSLLGIFDINMSLIYGEGGQNAFIRLQEQIMQDSDDQSIFAWESGLHATIGTGLLADSPALFKNSGQIVALRNWHQGEPFQMTNRGLRLYLPLLDSRDNRERDEQLFQGALACQHKQRNGTVLGILLGKILDSGDQYVRKNGRLYNIPTDELQVKTRWQSIATIGSVPSPSDIKESQNMHRWIYVRKAIQFPQKEELVSPGDLVAFRITFSEETDSIWTVSSYPNPNQMKNELPVEVTPPRTAEFRWNPAVWSWHAILVFTETFHPFHPQMLPRSKKSKENFYLAVGWNGLTRITWTDLGRLGSTLSTAQEVHQRYTTPYLKQLCNAVTLKHGYQGVDCEVKISHFEVGPMDGGREMHNVVLNVRLHQPTPVVLVSEASSSSSPSPKKPNWIQKKLTPRDR